MAACYWVASPGIGPGTTPLSMRLLCPVELRGHCPGAATLDRRGPFFRCAIGSGDREHAIAPVAHPGDAARLDEPVHCGTNLLCVRQVQRCRELGAREEVIGACGHGAQEPIVDRARVGPRG